ncbi:MAG: DNA repair protein RadA [Bacteroidetes bacterium]|jgi:DNA repair protein RadA/Sms|nr:DNA repair protein RadA [Bacteroidota bacterium]MBT5528057.1 DNA repair protein RadA [Cytophagia bacterium]MBT3424343.1 DNA repair protein RadA [Bacteroidota bacterium]MBT3799570.1 DNA repair protein RadA [Bacteroidota bacterium]MBT3934198.1 DNA repair protein RadA [Bacteroidota bacterium]
MAKLKSIFICQNCGTNSVKWQGKCASCGEWNTFVEEIVADKKTANKLRLKGSAAPTETLGNYDSIALSRIPLPDKELHRIIGNGLVPGSLLLLGGEPGIGKSTLLLQLALQMKDSIVLYISGEESINQIKLRAQRLGLVNSNCHLLPETNLEIIIQTIESLSPSILIIDSIQTLSTSLVESTAGSVVQIKECTARISDIAKKNNISAFLIGHITKEGYIAGPKILEHMVDTVLYFEGDRNYDYRILRTIKNRFGSVSDIGIYEMNEKGLEGVLNPSEVLLSQRDIDLSGISIAATLEGIRPMLIEIQALVTPSYYGTPQRTSTGFDNRRLSMLLAVLEKRCGLKMISQDVFLNIAGGIKVEDPSTDLAVFSALVSSFYDNPISNNSCFAGEIGLSGEIRPVRQLGKRISEAEKLGFDQIFVSSYNKKIQAHSSKIKVIALETVQQLLKKLFITS